MTPIFSKESFAEFYSKSNKAYVPNFSEKQALVECLIREFRTGKLESLKEEEVKSRFVNEIFGDVLGFHYGTSEHWCLREEAKSKIDATKPDAALGYFSKYKDDDDVRAVIEIKGSKTDLDAKQVGRGGKTSVDQAFEYSPKMGGKCKWVIVSNFTEIRFYAANDRSRFQSYLLIDLADESILKEMLFFFHKDRLIAKDRNSKTDNYYVQAISRIDGRVKKLHIIDRIYDSLKRFEDLGFVDPNYICTLAPFNILDEHVWHYDHNLLFTINSDIFELLQEIAIVNGSVTISDNYINKNELRVSDAGSKLKWSFNFLNRCGIDHISAIKDYRDCAMRRSGGFGFSYLHSFSFNDEEGITKSIEVREKKECDCLSCNYRNFDFKKLFSKLKMRTGNPENYDLELAYGNYLTVSNNYKDSYTIYKYLDDLKNQEKKGVKYFLTRLNLSSLHNLVRNNYLLEDKDEILKTIRSIDLDTIIHDELEFEIDNDVRRYLIQIKEERLTNKIKKEIKASRISIDKLKELYEGKGVQSGGPNLPNQIAEQYELLYLHNNRNFIIHDVFSEYKEIAEEVFEGLVRNYLTPEVGLIHFDEFFVREAIIHARSSELERILADVTVLKIGEGSIGFLLVQMMRYFESFFSRSSMAFDSYPDELMLEYSQHFSFQNKLCSIFSNIFIILEKASVSETQMHLLQPSLLDCLKTEKVLNWNNLEKLCKFLKSKGNLFDKNWLIELLKLAIEKDKPGNNKYNGLVSATSKAINKFYPETIIKGKGIFQKALANCYSLSHSRTDFRHYIHLIKIADSFGKSLFLGAIDQELKVEFHDDLYERLLREGIFTVDRENYFDTYLTHVARYSSNSIIFQNKVPIYYNFTFSNFALLMNQLQHRLQPAQLALFQNLNDFEMWLLNPAAFDSRKFKAYWLKTLPVKAVHLGQISRNQVIKNALKKELKEEFDPELSNIYCQYFLE